MQRISSENVIYKFTNDLKEVAKVKQNEEFVVETNDCFYQQITNSNLFKVICKFINYIF